MDYILAYILVHILHSGALRRLRCIRLPALYTLYTLYIMHYVLCSTSHRTSTADPTARPSFTEQIAQDECHFISRRDDRETILSARKFREVGVARRTSQLRSSSNKARSHPIDVFFKLS